MTEYAIDNVRVVDDSHTMIGSTRHAVVKGINACNSIGRNPQASFLFDFPDHRGLWIFTEFNAAAGQSPFSSLGHLAGQAAEQYKVAVEHEPVG